LTLHPDKSRFIIHSRDKLININLNGSPLTRVGYDCQEESVKLLGLHIDERLDWKVHVKNVLKKISKGGYLLWRNKKKLSTSSKKTIYESFIRSHLIYCLAVWGSAKPSVLAPLNKAIKKAIRHIGPYKQHTFNRLTNLNILKIEDELSLSESKIVWRWDKGKIPDSLKPILNEKQLPLRGRRFEIPRHSSLNTIEYRLAKRANTSIMTLSNFNTKKTLSTNVKKEIINTKDSFVCSRRTCYICTR